MHRTATKPFEWVQATETGCPTGYKACSSKTTNWWDRFCIENSKEAATECPILGMQFVPISQVSSLTSEWTFLQFTSSVALAYTKTDSTGAPIALTSVSPQPCLDPQDELGFAVDDYLYKLEKDQRKTECTIDIKDAPPNDPRYSLLENYQVS